MRITLTDDDGNLSETFETDLYFLDDLRNQIEDLLATNGLRECEKCGRWRDMNAEAVPCDLNFICRACEGKATDPAIDSDPN